MSDPFLGEVRLFSFNFPPRGWALCDGTLLAINQNTALFSLLGTLYGGNGQTNFALPDLRGRVPLHFSPNGYTQGQKGGEEAVTITGSTMAGHRHGLLGTPTRANNRNPASTLAASATPTNYYYSPPTLPVQLNPNSIGTVGGGQSHNNMQPFEVISYCISLVGLYPSRN